MSPEEIRSHLEGWSAIWGTPALPHEVRVRSSRRMYRSLGNYSPSRDEIRIAAHLLGTGGRDMFLEVLGHEAAHAAVRRLHPRGVRPHGPEWKALMRQAGLPPRACLPVPPAVAEVVAERRARRRAAGRRGWAVASPNAGGAIAPGSQTRTPPRSRQVRPPGSRSPSKPRGSASSSRRRGHPAPPHDRDSIGRLAPGEVVEDSIRPVRSVPREERPIQGELPLWEHSAVEKAQRWIEKGVEEIRRELRRRGIRR